jgi:hypothetical protein
MDLRKTIEDLHREKEKLDRIIASFEELLGAERIATFQKKRRGRKLMSAKERLEVSARMKQYWQARRASGSGS